MDKFYLFGWENICQNNLISLTVKYCCRRWRTEQRWMKIQLRTTSDREGEWPEDFWSMNSIAFGECREQESQFSLIDLHGKSQEIKYHTSAAIIFQNYLGGILYMLTAEYDCLMLISKETKYAIKCILIGPEGWCGSRESTLLVNAATLYVDKYCQSRCNVMDWLQN